MWARLDSNQGPTDYEFVIADAAHAEPLGLISLRIAERDPGLAAVGYWLRPEARGRGAAI
jgi:RimJ/RimL family protein N-acetyltransferase